MNPQPTTLAPKPAVAPCGRIEMRRRDRAVTDDSWIRRMLHTAGVGVLATAVEGQPFVNGNLFVYVETAHAIYLHTARHGRTRDAVAANERVAFTVMELGRLLPADTALAFSSEYAAVVVFGCGALVTDRDEARFALQRLLDKYFPDLRPGTHYRQTTDEELSRTTVYRIAIQEWSGKRKRVDDDFAGARRFVEHSMLRDLEGGRDSTRPSSEPREWRRDHFLGVKGLK